MKTLQLLGDLEFHDAEAHAQPLFVDKNGRVLRFTLKPGQSIKEHKAPNSPFYVVVLKGQGMFSGGDGQEKSFGSNSLLPLTNTWVGSWPAGRTRFQDLVTWRASATAADRSDG